MSSTIFLSVMSLWVDSYCLNKGKDKKNRNGFGLQVEMGVI